MSKGNWPNGWDLSHPNWTASTPSQYGGKLSAEEGGPSVLAQVILGALVVVMLTTFAISAVIMLFL